MKTDTADAWHLAEMYYRGEVKPHRKWEDEVLELQHLTRQHEFVTSLYVQAKLNMRALLDQVLPAYERVFFDLYSKTSLLVLLHYLTGNEDKIEEIILKCTGKSHSGEWINQKMSLLQGTFREDSVLKGKSEAQASSLQCVVEIVLNLKEQLNRLEEQIEETAVSVPQVELLKTIPGIGNKLAATIAAEIGDVSQFTHAKQLIAYAGLDPGVFSSGKFTATNNRITKRGSKRLRRAAYLAVQSGIRTGSNKRLKDYFDKKKEEGKPYKVAVIACANKLLHHVYAMLTRGEPYRTI